MTYEACAPAPITTMDFSCAVAMRSNASGNASDDRQGFGALKLAVTDAERDMNLPTLHRRDNPMNAIEDPLGASWFRERDYLIRTAYFGSSPCPGRHHPAFHSIPRVLNSATAIQNSIHIWWASFSDTTNPHCQLTLDPIRSAGGGRAIRILGMEQSGNPPVDFFVCKNDGKP
jgi:hypothetical protein